MGDKGRHSAVFQCIFYCHRLWFKEVKFIWLQQKTNSINFIYLMKDSDFLHILNLGYSIVMLPSSQTY